MTIGLRKVSVYKTLGVAAITTAAVISCGKAKDSVVPPAVTSGGSGTTPSGSGSTLWDKACTQAEGGYICNHAAVSEYFAASGSSPFESNMDTYTFELSDTANDWVVKDANGTDITDTGMTLTQGKPVKWKAISSVANSAAKAHYLDEPMLWFNSSLFKMEDAGVFSITGPYVNAVENRQTSSDAAAAGYELSVYFIPMVKGTYSAYCQISVKNGSDYRVIRSGAVTPDMTSGHANSGMKIAVTVAGDKDVSMSTPHATNAAASQRAALDNHPWSDDKSVAPLNGPNWTASSPTGKHLWNSASTGTATLFTYATNSVCTSNGQLSVNVDYAGAASTAVTLTGYCPFLVGNGEDFTTYSNAANSGSATAVTTAAPLKLRTGHAHILRIANAGSADMTLDVETLTRSFTIRKFQSEDGEFKVDFAKTITVKAGKWVEMWAVPMKAGDYTITTSAGTKVPVQVANTL